MKQVGNYQKLGFVNHIFNLFFAFAFLCVVSFGRNDHRFNFLRLDHRRICMTEVSYKHHIFSAKYHLYGNIHTTIFSFYYTTSQVHTIIKSWQIAQDISNLILRFLSLRVLLFRFSFHPIVVRKTCQITFRKVTD